MKKLTLLSLALISLAANMELQAQNQNKKILVAYFSATGNTRSVATHISNVLNATLHEIRPQVLYTTADLNWRDNSSRSSTENNNVSARPAISGSVENI